MIVQLKPTDAEYSDLQIVPELWSAERQHQLDRSCWCIPELVEVAPKTRTNSAVNAGDKPYTEVRHK